MSLIVAFCIVSWSVFGASGQVVIELPFGKLEGDSFTVNNTSISRFLGIPYAEPPVGQFRFKKPLPWVSRWNGTRSAKSPPKSCLQSILAHDQVSEDCLFLNVWTPVEIGNASHIKKPVLVFIHGGAFMVGSSSDSSLEATNLAPAIDAVVVTLNYRLGPIGFMYGGTEEIPGNVALYDQALALKWVQQNIHLFGGDPDLVTVSGGSAGGMSTSLHLVSPISKGLFKHAMIMSGVLLDSQMVSHKSTSLQNSRALAEILGCSPNKVGPLDKKTIDCLLGLDAMNFILKQWPKETLANSFKNSLPFFPMAGDDFVPQLPQKMIEDQMVKPNGSVLIGTVSFDGTVFEPIVQTYIRLVLTNITKPSNRDMLKILLNVSGGKYARAVNDADQLYFGSLKNPTERETKQALLESLGDIFFDCPTNKFAELLSNQTTVYQYVFTYQVKSERCDGFLPCHGNDGGLFFRTNIQSESDRIVADEMSRAVKQFIRSGEMPWMPYYRVSSGFLVPSYHKYEPFKTLTPKEYQHRGLTCAFWKQALQ